MKIALRLLLGLVALAALVFYVAGSQMPRQHRSRVAVTLRANRAAVMPARWPAMKAVRAERLADGTELTWNTDSHGQAVPFRIGESRPLEKLVRVIATDQLPFGGTWTYELADAPAGGTQLTLTEEGFINPPIFCAMAQWSVGFDTTQRDFLAYLEQHLAAAGKI